LVAQRHLRGPVEQSSTGRGAGFKAGFVWPRPSCPLSWNVSYSFPGRVRKPLELGMGTVWPIRNGRSTRQVCPPSSGLTERSIRHSRIVSFFRLHSRLRFDGFRAERLRATRVPLRASTAHSNSLFSSTLPSTHPQQAERRPFLSYNPLPMTFGK
jgi:hypothetical protein